MIGIHTKRKSIVPLKSSNNLYCKERVWEKCAHSASSEDMQWEGSAQNSQFGTPLACAFILLACLYLTEIGENTETSNP